MTAAKCGFSNAVVQILRMHGIKNDAHDVLADEALRQGVKDFSNWPTMLQVFINDDFVGGCNIPLQMHQNCELVEENDQVVVFMKGMLDEPKCGSSNAVVQILLMHGIKYDAHDVLADEALRQGVKDFSNWPTMPQVFINDDFVGGCDIPLQMHQNCELVEQV